MAPNYLCIRQHSLEDCGAASMATVAGHYGQSISLTTAREAVGVGSTGTTLLGLRRGAEALGFRARQVKASKELLEKLEAVPLPAILHWQGVHWVVLHGYERGRYVIADPAVGLRRLSREELEQAWDGIMLLLEPDPARFKAQATDNQPSSSTISTLDRLWPYRAILLESLGLNVAIGLVALVIPFLIQVLTDDVLVGGDRQMLTVFALGAAALTLFNSLMEWIQRSLVVYVAQRFELSFTLDFGRQLLRLPLDYYETRNSGDVSARLQDIQAFNRLLLQTLITLPSEGLTAVVALVLITIYSPELAAWAVGLAILVIAPAALTWKTLQQRARNQLIMAGDNQGLLVETFKGAMTVKSLNAAPQLWNDIQGRLGRLAKYSFNTIRLGITLGLLAKLTMGLNTIAILWLGGQMVTAQQLSIGQLLAVHSLNQTLTMFLMRLVQWADEFAQVKAVAMRILDVIEATPEQGQFVNPALVNPAGEGAAETMTTAGGVTAGTSRQTPASLPFVTLSSSADIACTALSFGYSGRVNLMDELSLTIPGGQTTALIGESGCGKSTLVKLLAGLYPLQSGNIAFGPYNLQDIALDCLRQQVCLVPQEAHFWRRSIIENFRLIDPHLSFEKIVAACQLAQAHDFISQLPNKYQTILGEYGSNLSGGQKQRLAIARALLQDPTVLVLDESTSALDPIAEAQLLENLLTHRQGKTTLLISHRPQVIRRADWIVFLEQGAVQQQGTYPELVEIAGDHRHFL